MPYASRNATTGWDPATGLGTLNLQKFCRPRSLIRAWVFVDRSVPAVHSLVPEKALLAKYEWWLRRWIKLKAGVVCCWLLPQRRVFECNFVTSLLYGSKG